MEASVYVSFLLISIAVLVFPGPSILLIVANSLQRGVVVGLYTVAGGLAAMLVQLLVALAGLTSIVTVFASGFSYLRWAGAAYLVYLGVQRWRGTPHAELRGRSVRNYRSALAAGFIVALTNPGTMLFFVAFFPQFISDSSPAGPQLLLMSISFMVLTTLVDSCYAFFSARIGHRLRESRYAEARNRLAGAILIAAAVLLVLVKI